MAKAKLRVQWLGSRREAEIGPGELWQSDDDDLADYLNTLYAPVGEAGGWPWVEAFRLAVKNLRAEVVREATVPAGPPGRVY